MNWMRQVKKFKIYMLEGVMDSYKNAPLGFTVTTIYDPVKEYKAELSGQQLVVIIRRGRYSEVQGLPKGWRVVVESVSC